LACPGLAARAGRRAAAWVRLSRFELALAAVESKQVVHGDRELRRHGVLDAALRDEVRRAGIATVIRPCVAALRAVKDKECAAAGSAS
jgi:hypothetical protein